VRQFFAVVAECLYFIVAGERASPEQWQRREHDLK